MLFKGLPPLLSGIKDGKTKWQQLDNVDFEKIGHFLSSHLVIEHYMEKYISAYSPAPFNWEGAGLTFNQKIILMSGLKHFPEPFNIPPVLKHLNSVRNKLSHKIDFELSDEHLLPIRQFISKTTKPEAGLSDGDFESTLSTFTMLVCAYFASAITYCEEQKANNRNGNWVL
ncbi:hypothetical protein [Stutzerimonas nitrititolerans]|uniref:hypothetical protein n=1 Tax=Stutzerimonas nitrititolerans TaxID=2482751 RepID=UPI0028A7FF21|nr:hypothetical protein [Stutzerimonas nitrititolerans]